MSVVYLVLNEKANKTWAIKEVRKDGQQDFTTVKQGLIAETNILKELKDETINAKDALKAGGKVLRLQGGKSVVKIGGATLRSTEQYLSSFQVSTDDFTGSVPGKVKEAATNTGNILKKITNVVLHPLRNLIAMGKVILMGAVILLFLIIKQQGLSSLFCY